REISQVREKKTEVDMNRFLITTALLAVIGVAPAHATLQIAAQIGPDSFFCADQTACDTNPTVNVLQVADTIIDGIAVAGSLQFAEFGASSVLNTGSLSITNTIATPITITVAVGATGFLPIARQINSAGSGVWQGPGSSTILMNWSVDAANGQGADNAFD